MKYDDIDTIVQMFEGERLAIDYGGATQEQMLMLEDILNDATNVRPHNNQSFSQHMATFLPQGFCYLVYSGGSKNASSYKSRVPSCRDIIINIQDVINSSMHSGMTDEDFESVFE